MQENNILKTCLLLGDIFITQIALFLALFLRKRELLEQFNDFSYDFIPIYAVWIFTIFLLDLYNIYFLKKRTDFFFSVIIFTVVAFFSAIAFFYFKPDYGPSPKTILILNVLAFSALFVVWRFGFNWLFGIKGLKEKAVIAGSPENVKSIALQIKDHYDVVALFAPVSMGNVGVSPDLTRAIGDLKKIVVEKKVTSLIFTPDVYLDKDVVGEIFFHLPLTIRYLDFNDVYEFINKKVPLQHVNEAWFLEKISKPENRLGSFVKRLVDIIISMAGLLIFFSLLPIIALTIVLDSKGGVFYRQQRVGKNGKVFAICKFRTMVKHDPQSGEVWRGGVAGAVTGAGKVLRRLHLDELPQAWSMFKGDISFVGPRPEWTQLAATFEKEIPFYRQRYLVKPGIIGWAQINFPASHSVAEVREKFQYDLYYIKNRSILLDVEITLKAIKLFFR